MNYEKRNKHMTLDDRIEIQECLNKGMTFKAIAQRIEKDQTTVSKEVKLHGKVHANGFTKTDECCPKLLKAPFVCNGCPKRNHNNCQYPRSVYHAKTAQKEYEMVLVESREGIPLTKEDFQTKEVDTKLKDLASKIQYQFIRIEDLEITQRGNINALGQQVPYVKFKAQTVNLPFAEIQGIIGATTDKNGKNKMILAINDSKKYSQIITQEFFKDAK